MKSEDGFEALDVLEGSTILCESDREGLDVSVVRGLGNHLIRQRCIARQPAAPVSMEWMVTTSATPQVT